MRTPDWIDDILAALDAKDIDAFCEPLSEDCTFIYANEDPVEGIEAIHDFVTYFAESIEASDHQVQETYRSPNRVVVRGDVIYTKKDGSTLDVPFVDVFEMEDGEVSTYQVYADNHELDL